VPVAAQVGVVLRHDDDMALADFDVALASGAHVALARRIALDGYRHLVVEGVQPAVAAHTTNTAVMAIVTITRTTSSADRRRLRNGLKPMTAWYDRGAGVVCPHVRSE